MKKYILLLSIFLLATTATLACDVCGCSLGGNYFGLLPAFNKNFVGLRWSQAKFYAYMNHQSEYLQNEYSNDTYRKLEVWGRFNIGKRVQLFAFVPYSYNDMNGSEQKVKSSGLGDITIVGQYQVFKTSDETSTIQNMFSVGGGIKLPTGDNSKEDQGKLVNRNFQLGTGSVDFLLNAIYTVRYKKLGLNVEGGYKINTRNADDYRFGNQFYTSSQFVYSISTTKINLLPNAGLYFEKAQRHHDGITEITNTGGSATFLSTGLETYFNKFSLGVNYKHPLSQRYNSDSIADIETKDRWTIGVTYSF